MKVLIDISEDVFTRLFDNGVDARIDDLRQIEKAVRAGRPVLDKHTVIDVTDEELEEIKTEMCDKYCKHPESYRLFGDTEEEMIDEVCVNCPLSRL